MDIFARLDRFEDFVANSRRVPMSSSVMVNEAEFYDMLDDIRATLPNELKQARMITKDKERILSDAQRKEDELLAAAQEQTEQMISETEIIRQAELERAHMLQEAEEKAREIVLGAEDVADRIFGEMEASLIEVRDSTEEILSRVGTWRDKLRGYPEEAGGQEYEFEGDEEE